MKLKREFKSTNDGWPTLYVSELDETYHSTNGARTEAEHVFVKEAFMEHDSNSVCIFEIGFGTGLNAFVTILEALKSDKKVQYISIEKYPLTVDEILNLNLISILNTEDLELFNKLHSANWEETITIADNFSLKKINGDINTYSNIPTNIDIVYFDAFAPNKQTGIWGVPLFTDLYSKMNKHGILTTYCAQGQVRRDMQAAGFIVERIAGPPGKREMLRARKL